MKKLLIILSFLVSNFIYSQTSLTEDNYIDPNFPGLWSNIIDDEFLTINLNGSFVRTDINKNLLASGVIKMMNHQLHIIRNDKQDKYNLIYSITGTTLVVIKPYSTEAWVFNKIGN
tara:strand:+ start:316 stop:663 length:348 start_codon:yes stop_codon:yes gene_type:complete